MIDEDQRDRATRDGAWRWPPAVGVFVSFASLLVYTFGIFLKPLAEEFGWSREAVSAAFGIAAMTVAVCSPPLGYLLDRVSPRRDYCPVPDRLRLRLRVAVTADAAPVASLRVFVVLGHRRQRDGADGLLAGGDQLVRGDGEVWRWRS